MSNSGIDYDYEILAAGDQEKPWISVIVPIYNMGENGFLRECLTSLVKQDFQNLEIICVDDASTDNSVDIALEFAHEHRSISVLRLKENGRQGTACNCAIRLARGRYIGFVDADDYVSNDFYSSLWSEAIATGADMIEASVQIVDEEGQSIGEPRVGFPSECLTERVNELSDLDVVAKQNRAILDHPSMRYCIHRAEIVKKPGNEFLERMAYEDTPTLLRWLYDCKSFARSKGGQYFYRQHSASTTHTTICDPKKIRDRLKSAEMILDDAVRLGQFEAHEQSLNAYFLDVYLFNTLSMMASGHEDLSKELIRSVARRAKERVPEYKTTIMRRSTATRDVLIMRLMVEFPVVYCKLRRAREGRA